MVALSRRWNGSWRAWTGATASLRARRDLPASRRIAAIAATGLLGLLLGLLFLWGGPQALAACPGPCSRESLQTGLVNPPAWARGLHIHFEPSSPAASPYVSPRPGAGVFSRGIPSELPGLVGAESGPGEGTTPLLYHEGAGVQETPKVFLIFWGSNFEEKASPPTTNEVHARETKEMLLNLFKGLSSTEPGKAWQGVLTQYFDSKGHVSPQVEVASYIDNREPAPKSVGHDQISAEVAKAIELVHADNTVPAAEKEKWKPELNAQFIVVTAPGSTFEAGFAGGFCAYHNTTPEGTVYGFVPYQGDPPFSTNGCVKSEAEIVPKTSKAASHEYAETVTDPVPIGAPSEWRAGQGSEIGDLCEASQIELKSVGAWVQRIYDDHLNGCALEDPSPPWVYTLTGSAGASGNEAELTGTVNPEREKATYYFEYGPTTAYGSKTPEAAIEPGETNRNVEVSQIIPSGLQPQTTYHYRLVAANVGGGPRAGKTNGIDKTFTTQAAESPFVASVQPSEGPEAGGTSVTITGSYLKSVTSVKFGSHEAQSFVVNSEGSISAVTPPGGGLVDVTVTNPHGTSAAHPSDRYGYGGPPTVTGVQPSKGAENGGTSVTITGTNLASVREVKFGLSPARSFVVNSETSVTAVSSGGSGPVDVRVTNARGTSPASSADRFEYAPFPTITEVSPGVSSVGVQPDVGPQAGGSTVTITGTHLNNATAVKFGSAQAASFKVGSESSLTAVSPPGTGVVDVTVTNPIGTSVTNHGDRFAYEPPPSNAERAVAWGGNSFGELGNGGIESTPVPGAVSGLGEVTAVSGSVSANGTESSLALLANGTADAWGGNEGGGLGDGTTEGSLLAGPVSGLSEVSAISMGDRAGLALLKNGTVKAWGARFGVVGDGTSQDKHVPVSVCAVGEKKAPCSQSLSEVSAVAASEGFALALLNNGTVVAWGENRQGQLGNGTINSSSVPVPVSGLSEVTAIAAGSNFALALLKNGTVEAWGYNQSGQLGTGSTKGPEECREKGQYCSKVPVPVSGLSEVSAISAGSERSLALLSNGTVRSWGAAMLGNGTTENSDLPVPVSGLSEVKAISAGGDSLALLKEGAVKAWGAGSTVPVSVNSLSHVTAISAGSEFNLAIGKAGP